VLAQATPKRLTGHCSGSLFRPEPLAPKVSAGGHVQSLDHRVKLGRLQGFANKPQLPHRARHVRSARVVLGV